MWNIEVDYCPFCATRDTIQEFNRVKIDPSRIPAEGICSVSETGSEPCQYPFDKSGCSKRERQDFCDRSWARGELYNIWNVVKKGDTDLK